MTRYLKMSEACSLASMSRNTLRKYLERGDIAGNKVGTRGDWRIDEESLERFLKGVNRIKARDIIRSLRG